MDMILQEEIKAKSVELCKDSNGGDHLAKNVISLHKMMVSKADYATLALLKAAFKDWEKSKLNNPHKDKQ